MSKTQLTLSAASLNSQTTPATLGGDNLLSFVESIVSPCAFILSLWAVTYYFESYVPAHYLVLSVLVFALTFPGRPRLHTPKFELLRDIALNWCLTVGILLFAALGLGYMQEFSKAVLTVWLWAAPLTELCAVVVLRLSAPFLVNLQGPPQRAIIVGMNEQGLALAASIKKTAYCRIDVVGFVDSRSTTRLNSPPNTRLLGQLPDLARLIQATQAQLIYLSLPMASQPRILQILDDLKDTTASIYFVPDMFLTDLIQGHPSSVCGLPVISVCETPFRGTNGATKRISDIVISLIILTLILPLLLIIAVAVKMGSSGPVIFKQRRYGLDGEEILVYKFRSMTVTEDGGVIQQAKKNDSRITPLGGFLRRTSLDELPQFINVLQGRMSVVGPRPHAVSHNELYRKLIKGYMVRHKVKPGITGWAQVNGFRGETDVLEKMQGRIDYDLDYLRNWSLQLDLHIIFKTVGLVIKDRQAY